MSKRKTVFYSSLITHHSSLLFRSSGRFVVAVGDEARARRVVFRSFAAGPHVALGFPFRLDLVELAVLSLPRRRNRDFALKVGAEELRDACGFQAVERVLRGMAVAVEFAQRDDGRLRLRVVFAEDALEKVF